MGFQNRKKIYAIGAFVFVFVLYFFPKLFGGKSAVAPLEYREQVEFKGIEIHIARATTLAQEMRGLSFQESIGESDGLLFVFDSPDLYGIWMKDMIFPIDVFWFDENFHVVFIKKNFSPKSYPESVMSEIPTQYVLETKAGFADEHNIQLGDSLVFPNKGGVQGGFPSPM